MATRPAPGNRNRVAVSYKDKDALARARREAAQYGVAGARGGANNRNKFGSEDIFDPITGVSGAYNLVTTDYNPENIKYEQRTVPTIRGGMMSGGQPNIGSSIFGIIQALAGSVNDRLNPVVNPIDAEIAEKARGNPLGLRAAMQNLTPEVRRERENEQALLDREREYSNLLSTLKAAGITSEEELYRSAVVSPDGQVNLNPNAQAAIAQLGNAADSLRLLDVTGSGKPVTMGASFAGKQAAKQVSRGLDSLIPRVASVANNPTFINAGMDTVRAATAGAPLEQSVATGLASLVAGNKPISNVELRLTPEQHGLLLSEGLDAKAPRGGNRGLAATLASNVQSALRRPQAGSGGERVPVGEMKVKFTAEDAVRIAEENPELMKNNAAYIDLYRTSPQGSNKPGSIFVHAHPPGMNPSEVKDVLPDHLTSGPLNDLEAKVNGARRANGIDPLTNYTDIVTEGIALAKNGKFKEGTWNAKLADMTLEEAQIYLGGNGVKYW
jgi:hypothetical protein